LIKTPNIDQLAAEGVKLTQFYTSGNVCTPSRAGLLTGKYPIRTGLANRTIAPNGPGGLSAEELTIAEQLSDLGYKTGLVGKWHLGNGPEHHPNQHGFQTFFGILSSNDFPDQALYRNTDIVHERINAQMLAVDFTGEAERFIDKNAAHPFFLMLSTTSPHKPLLPAPEFSNLSEAGHYGDVVEELDWTVGQLVTALDRNGLTENTVIIFTSDNGPFPEGSTGGLRGGKGNGWDGGYRVPLIIKWPNNIPEGTVSSAMSMNFDLKPTLLSIAGARENTDEVIDGRNILPLLMGSNTSPHDVLYFFNNERISALRTNDWRLVLSDYPPWRDAEPIRFDKNKMLQTLMYNMHLTPDQQYDLSDRYPDDKKQLEQYLAQGRQTLEALSTHDDSDQYGDSVD